MGTQDIPNDIVNNAAQLPITVAVAFTVAYIKTKTCSKRSRRSAEWRQDIIRAWTGVTYSIGLMVAISEWTSNEPCVTLLYLSVVSTFIGFFIESLIMYAARSNGMLVGYYGSPLQFERVMSQIMFTLLMATCGIAVSYMILSMPRLGLTDTSNYECDPNVVAYYMPAMYAACRCAAMDSDFYRHGTSWASTVTSTTSASHFSIESDGDDTDVAENPMRPTDETVGSPNHHNDDNDENTV